MNEMNELEKCMGLWQPRRPSPKVKHLVFAAQAVGAEKLPESAAGLAGAIEGALQGAERSASRLLLRWLAPAMAASLLMVAFVNQRNDTQMSGSANSVPMVALMLSNQSATAYLASGSQPAQNRVTPATFEFTNRSSLTSSIRSFAVPHE